MSVRQTIGAIAAGLAVGLLLVGGLLLRGGQGSPAGPGAAGGPATPAPVVTPAPVDTAVVPIRDAPPLRLTDQDGRPFDLVSLRGSPVLVFFGYTHCPDVCPTTLADVRDAVRHSPTPVRVVFVSVDPARDTPEAMKQYVGFYQAGFIGLTGTEAEVRAAADDWGVRYARVDTGSASGYAMSHTADTFLVDADGRLRHRVPFGAGPEVFLDRIASVASGTGGVPTAAPTSGASPTPGASATAAPASSAVPASPASPAPSPGVSAAPTPSGGVGLRPELVSTVVRAGPNRLVVVLRDAGGHDIGYPDTTVRFAFRPASDPNAAPIEADSQFVWTVVGARGAYVADVTFPSAGDWNAAVTATEKSGSVSEGPMAVAVEESAPTPAVGAAAPSVRTPIAADVDGNLRLISSDNFPEPAFYEHSVDELLAAKRPFVLTFYSPGFCPTTACGPLMRNLKSLAGEFPETAFVHVEPYVMQQWAGTIRPVVVDGYFQWAAWSRAYGLPVEPWIFVVDGSGRIAASFEVIVGTDELRAAIRAAGGG